MADPPPHVRPPTPCVGAFVGRVRGDTESILHGHAYFDHGVDVPELGTKILQVVLEHAADETSSRHQIRFLTRQEELPGVGLQRFPAQRVTEGFLAFYDVTTPGRRTGYYLSESGDLQLKAVSHLEIACIFDFTAEGVNTFDLLGVTGRRVEVVGSFVAKRHSETFAIANPHAVRLDD